MGDFYLKGTKETPEINLETKRGFFGLSGVSLPENPDEFFGTILEELEEYFNSPAKTTTCIFKMAYFNSASSKKIYDILLVIKAAIDNGKNVEIKWQTFEDDEDMIEAGEEYADLAEVPIEIEFIEV